MTASNYVLYSLYKPCPVPEFLNTLLSSWIVGNLVSLNRLIHYFKKLTCQWYGRRPMSYFFHCWVVRKRISHNSLFSVGLLYTISTVQLTFPLTCFSFHRGSEQCLRQVRHTGANVFHSSESLSPHHHCHHWICSTGERSDGHEPKFRFQFYKLLYLS